MTQAVRWAKRRWLGAAWAVLLLGACAPAPAVDYDLWLLAGQSNMDGRGKTKELTAEQRAPSDRAVIFYRNPPTASEAFAPLAPGFSMPPGYHGKLPSEVFGPELGFARTLLKADDKLRLALIKGSRGGTSLRTDWKPGDPGAPESQGPCYRNFLATWRLATAALTKDGSTFKLRGLLWHQGESDAGLKQADYLKLLTRFVARLREDLGAPDLPVLIGEVYDNGKRDAVRAAEKEAGDTIPHALFVSAAGLKTFDNGTHFDAASQLLLGERFAEAAGKVK